jgi:hypothetical protein
MAKDVVNAGLADDGNGWLDRARAGVLAVLAGVPEGRLAQQLRQAVPMIDVKVTASANNPWSASRVLTHLGVTAYIVRADNTGHWRTSRPRWTLMRHAEAARLTAWLGGVRIGTGYVPPAMNSDLSTKNAT